MNQATAWQLMAARMAEVLRDHEYDSEHWIDFDDGPEDYLNEDVTEMLAAYEEMVAAEGG